MYINNYYCSFNFLNSNLFFLSLTREIVKTFKAARSLIEKEIKDSGEQGAGDAQSPDSGVGTGSTPWAG